MNLLKKLMHSAKFWAVTFSFLSLLTFCFPQPAKALVFLPYPETEFLPIPKQVNISSAGTLDVVRQGDIKQRSVVTSAIVSLIPPQTGTIESITIIGPKGPVFGCPNNLRVFNGFDLIKACGGNAFLEAGHTLYRAVGKDFQPNSILKVDLKAYLVKDGTYREAKT